MSNLGQTDEDKLPLPLGTMVPDYGRIDVVGWTGGERYYWLTGPNGVAMVPAFIIEPLVRSSKTGAEK